MVKKTNERILDTALHLFNTRGLAKVTLRTIAQEMGISQGNLNYHFKKRQELIEALYFRLIDRLNERLSRPMDSKDLLHVLLQMSTSVMYDLYDYRFILLDFVQVMRENEKIRVHFVELKELRKKQFMQFFRMLIEADLMKPEELSNEHKNLHARMQMLGDFWISSAVIEEASLPKASIAKYAEVINQTIFPYLTPKGKKMFKASIKRIVR